MPSARIASFFNTEYLRNGKPNTIIVKISIFFFIIMLLLYYCLLLCCGSVKWSVHFAFRRESNFHRFYLLVNMNGHQSSIQ